MEQFFKPVHRPSGPDRIKPRRQHHHHHHHLHHQQDPHSQRYTMFEDTDRNTDESQGHLRHYLHDSHHHDTHRIHQAQQYSLSQEDEILYNHKTHVTVSRASSSSLSSSSSSSSFTSWYTDGSANDPFSLRRPEQPQHSLSCSNITDVRRGFREDTEPAIYATVKHDIVCSELQGSSQKRGKSIFSPLDRAHSRSDEALPQGNENDYRGEKTRVPHINYGPLYKTASLNRSLAFSEEDIVLGVSMGPKRAVSSSQLPGKGILKHKGPQNDIRKAKSMEVLSQRVSKGQDPSGQKSKGTTQVEIEQARANFVEGKLQFSAFLDEITKQVISPSALNILGVHNQKPTGKTPAPAPTPDPVKPQLPPKKHRESSAEEKEQHSRPHSRQDRTSRKNSDCSDTDKVISYAAKNHHGSPPPHHYPHAPSHNAHHESSHKDRRQPSAGGRAAGDRYIRCGPQLTDGTSTSPELSQPKSRHHRKQQPTGSHGQHTHHFPQQQPLQAHPGPGQGSESSSSKSDSSRATATSLSSEQSVQHHSQLVGHVKQRRDTPCDAELLLALQEENNDLHQNLVQTVVCIESLEAELQRSRDELCLVKEQYKSLQEAQSGTKQANNLLGEHLHIATESLGNERKYLLNRVYQLSTELEDAHRTMAALENINVPSLIKELLEKHFNSAEAIQKFLSTPAPASHAAATSPQAEGQSHAPKTEEAVHDWLAKSEARPQRVTAFLPFKQGAQAATGGDGGLSDPNEAPFSVADISDAIYKKMAESYAARAQPVYPQSQKEPQPGTEHADAPPGLQQTQAQGAADSWCGKGGATVTLLEQADVDVTSSTAQQILDDFLQQLQHNEAGGGTEQQGRQGWPGGAEQTGKVAD